MARYSTELNTFLNLIVADAEAGTLGPSLVDTNFKHADAFHRALCARMLQEVVSAAMDQGISVKTSGVTTAVKFDGQQIVAALQQQIGSVDDGNGMISQATNGSGGGRIG